MTIARRTFLGAGLAAAAANGARRRVGIVGAGTSGVALAWLLDGERDVVLLERGSAIGGNVQSIPVTLDGHTFPVDMGAQYFHPGAHPVYVRLLEYLGLGPATAEAHPFPASITVYAGGEATPRFVSPVLPDRAWPLLAPWNQPAVAAFARAFAAAKQREQQDGSWLLTTEAWLALLGFTAAQRDTLLLPWVASLFSGSIEEARLISARVAMYFAAKALPDNPLETINYFVLRKGLVEALHRMLAQVSTVEVRTSADVTAVVRLPAGGFRIHHGASSADVDDVVFAASAGSSRKLLTTIPGTIAQQLALDRFEMRDARLVLHTGPAYAPAVPAYRSFLNCGVEDGTCEASMSMADVLADPPPATAAKLWKTWVTHRPKPAQVVHESHFRHMLPTAKTIGGQIALDARQGDGNIFFAGGYLLPVDSQEAALVSALRVASLMQAGTARARLLA